MEWEFTPAQLVKGEVAYDLESFRRDLAQEVANNVPARDAAQSRPTYDLIYDLCYWLATGKPLAGLLAAFDEDPETRDWLAALRPFMQANVDMLGAILQKEIMDRVAAGRPLEQALQAVASRHAELGRARPLN
jgi:hypothetical protein